MSKLAIFIQKLLTCFTPKLSKMKPKIKVNYENRTMLLPYFANQLVRFLSKSIHTKSGIPNLHYQAISMFAVYLGSEKEHFRSMKTNH